MPGALSLVERGGKFAVECRFHPDLDLVADTWEEADVLADEHDEAEDADDSLSVSCP